MCGFFKRHIALRGGQRFELDFRRSQRQQECQSIVHARVGVNNDLFGVIILEISLRVSSIATKQSLPNLEISSLSAKRVTPNDINLSTSSFVGNEG